MESYNAFASYYDELMEDARYEERCRYILEAARRFDHPMGRTLDLACGTGSLTLLLRQSGVDVFGADASADMLSLAMQKCIEAGEPILFVQQEMQALTLPETVDTCVCTLDSINHLTDEKDVQRAFERISRYMNAGGLFIFDVNTVYKHREVLADNVFVMENERGCGARFLCGGERRLPPQQRGLFGARLQRRTAARHAGTGRLCGFGGLRRSVL